MSELIFLDRLFEGQHFVVLNDGTETWEIARPTTRAGRACARAYARVQTRVRDYDFQILSYGVKFIKQNWKETLYTFGLFKYFE